jgi:hypothetical protein
MGATKTMEAGSQVQPEWSPSKRRGSHTGVKARIREPSKGLTMDPNRKGKFDNKSPYGKTCEKDARQGNNGEAINLASLSFGSDTEYMAEMYIIVDPEVEQSDSLEMKSLLQPEIIRAVTSTLDIRFEGRRVFFPTFTRYFLARE